MTRTDNYKIMDKAIRDAKREVYSNIINNLRNTSFGLPFHKKE